MRLTQQLAIFPVCESDDYGSVGEDFDSFKLSLLNHATIVISFGAITGNSVLKVYSGASAGTKTTAETFTYRVTGADYEAANSDLWGTEATSAALTLTAASYDHRGLAIEIDPATITAGQEWITVEVDNTATALNMAAVLVAEPKWAPCPTVLA
jgi:hypothetical protein